MSLAPRAGTKKWSPEATQGQFFVFLSIEFFSSLNTSIFFFFLWWCSIVNKSIQDRPQDTLETWLSTHIFILWVDGSELHARDHVAQSKNHAQYFARHISEGRKTNSSIYRKANSISSTDENTRSNWKAAVLLGMRICDEERILWYSVFIPMGHNWDFWTRLFRSWKAVGFFFLCHGVFFFCLFCSKSSIMSWADITIFYNDVKIISLVKLRAWRHD